MTITTPLNLPGSPPTPAMLLVARGIRDAVAILNNMESHARCKAYDNMTFHGPFFVRDPNNPNLVGNCKNCGGTGVEINSKSMARACGFNHAELFADPEPEPVKMKLPSSPVVSRCNDENDHDHPCRAVLFADGTLINHCADPCSFVMRKAGSGEPPFLHESDLVAEIEKLMLRKSRSDLRKG